MKYIWQFLIILGVSFVGEVLHFLIPLPIPASIYGIVLMLLGLSLKIIPLRAVKETGDFLVEIMPVLFIPAAVGLIASWTEIQSAWLEYLIVLVVTTVVVMAVSALVTQAVNRKNRREEEEQ